MPAPAVSVSSPGEDGDGNLAESGGPIAAPGETFPQEVMALKDRKGRSTTRGHVPPYIQIAEGVVESDAMRLTVEIALAARVPSQISSNESVRLTVGILDEEGHRYSLYAQASQDGWAPYAVGGEEGPFPGDLTIRGRRIRFEMPRDYFGALPTFRWLANIAYGKRNAYGFDALPENGYARFPRNS